MLNASYHKEKHYTCIYFGGGDLKIFLDIKPFMK